MATEQPYEYQDGDVTCKGVLVLPDGDDKRPGVVVFPDIAGVSTHSLGRAHRLADELGYVSLVADVYGNGEVPGLPDAHGVVASWISRPGDLATRSVAAIEALEAHPRCNGRIGAIGFCFGGAAVLSVVRSGRSNLRAGATFHAVLGTPEGAIPDKAKASLLVCHGADDPFAGDAALLGMVENIKATTLAEFLREMADASVDCQVIAYAGQVHSFTIPDADKFGTPGARYDKRTDDRSWKALVSFLDETL